ncbi:MAG: DUF3194 domain-containing protein [Halodesulfurarchaeum sp.]
MVDPETVVETASETANRYVFSQLEKSAVEDLEVTASFEDEVLEVEVSVVAPDAETDLERLATDATRLAGEAVDALLEKS